MSNNELITKDEKLPTTTEELQKFILIGDEVVNAEKAKLKAIKNTKLAQEIYLKHLKQAQEKARTVIEAVIRCGELLMEVQENPVKVIHGSPSQDGKPKLAGSEKSLPSNIPKELAYRYRTVYQNRNRVRKIVEDTINEANEKLPYWRSIFKKIQEKKGIEIPDLPDGVFNVIYIDPPWKYDFSSLLNDSTETSQHRISMYEKIRDYQDTNKKLITDLFADDSVIFMWTTPAKKRVSLLLLEEWNFTYIATYYWNKIISTFRVGYWAYGQVEELLVGKRGKINMPDIKEIELDGKKITNLHSEEEGKHKERPNYYYKLIETLYPNQKYIEIFARPGTEREKWTFWGNRY